jgi:hypothetical protein
MSAGVARSLCVAVGLRALPALPCSFPRWGDFASVPRATSWYFQHIMPLGDPSSFAPAICAFKLALLYLPGWVFKVVVTTECVCVCACVRVCVCVCTGTVQCVCVCVCPQAVTMSLELP